MAFPDIRKIPPLSIYAFRDVSENEALEIPEIEKNRKCTDTTSLIFFILALSLMILLVVASSINTDYKRLLNGYDKCGDTCGSKNNRVSKINCSGKDLINKPFMKYKLIEDTDDIFSYNMLPDSCADRCELPNQLLFHRCIRPNDNPVDRNGDISFAAFMDELNRSALAVIVPMSITGFVVSVGLFFCFHYSPKVTVFATIASTFIVLFSFMGYVWFWFSEDTSNNELFYIGIVSTISVFILAILICYFFDRYLLVVQMYIEATRAIFHMSLLILLPLLSLLILSIVVLTTVFLSALISTNQFLQKVEDFPFVYEYVNTQLSAIVIIYLIVMAIWFIFLVNGCQCMVVAGAVSNYYFERDKSELRSGVCRSCYIVVRYHIGTIALGSLCLTILTIARCTLKCFEYQKKWKHMLKCLSCCLVCFEQVMEYLTRKAYIQTAMHGKSLFKSGIRGARLLWANLIDTIALDVVAEFITICAMVFTTVISVAVGLICHETLYMNLDNILVCLVIGAATATTIAYFFMHIINVAAETIFMCFCEDKLLNDGRSRPYFMSEQLKALVDKAKEIARSRED